MQKTLAEIAQLVDGELVGDGAVKITGLNRLDAAGEGDLAFADMAHAPLAKSSKATAVLMPAKFSGEFPKNAIKIQAENPRPVFAKLLEIFTPKIEIPVGVSDKAFVGENVTLGENVSIMPFAYVGDNAVIGDGVKIYPHTYIGNFAKIDSDTVIFSNVTVREHCKIGKRYVIHASTVIGADGFGFTTVDGVHTKVPQVGNVVVGDDVEIGANVGIDRAAMGSTLIGSGTKIDNLVHIAHNCIIGKNCLIVAQTGISGSTVVGDNVTFGGQVGTVGHIKIGSNSVYAARSGISKSMPENFFGAGFPIQPHGDWLRLQSALKKVPELLKKVSKIEKLLKDNYIK